jgi:SpoVK/Ycf46/Vps4 family AAA+-type ATPase
LIRKGRFDQLFWIDLPSSEERAEIFNVVIRKHGRLPGDFSVYDFTSKTEGFTGAEIDELVKSALFNAFDVGEEIADSHIEHEIDLFIPFSVSHAEELQLMRAQAEGKLVMLSDDGETEKAEDGIRKLRIGI